MRGHQLLPSYRKVGFFLVCVLESALQSSRAFPLELACSRTIVFTSLLYNQPFLLTVSELTVTSSAFDTKLARLIIP